MVGRVSKKSKVDRTRDYTFAQREKVDLSDANAHTYTSRLLANHTSERDPVRAAFYFAGRTLMRCPKKGVSNYENCKG